MSFQNTMSQPGKILHEVISGALRSRGTSFEAWCKNNGVACASMRNITFGQSGGLRGRKLLDEIIADAGREVVTAAYRRRMDDEAKKLKQISGEAA